MNLFEIIGKKGDPYWGRDEDEKVYIVYNPDGTEYSRHPYKHEWNVSPAYNAALDDIRKLKNEINKQKQIDRENSPLNKIEQEYFALDQEIRKYVTALKAEIENPKDEAKIKAYDERMTYLQKVLGDQIRNSVILGTYKPK